MELHNSNSQDVTIAGSYDNLNQARMPQSVPVQSQLALSRKLTAIKTRFKDFKCSEAPGQCIDKKAPRLPYICEKKFLTYRDCFKLIVSCSPTEPWNSIRKKLVSTHHVRQSLICYMYDTILLITRWNHNLE